MAKLYEMIESLCRSRGIRPGRLCEEIGISRGLITDLKMGRKKSVSAETAQKIAGFFGVSVGHLLGQEDVLKDVDVAFYGEFLELSEEQKATVRDMVHLMRARRSAQEKEESV